MEGLFLIIVLLVVVIAIPISLSHARKADENWQRAARSLDLRFQASGFLSSRRIHGTYQSYRINIDTFSKGSGNHRKTYTRFTLSYPPIGLGLGLTEESFVTGVIKFFGAQDIQIGEKRFDESVVVKGHNPDRVREFLTTARQLRIRRFFSSHSGASINDTSVNWNERGLIRDERRLVRVVQEMCRLAVSLGDDENETLQHALDEQELGHTERAIEILRDHRQGHGSPGDVVDPDEGFLEGELLYLAGKPAEAQQVFDVARKASPDDEEILEWATALNDAEPPEPQQVDAAAQEPAEDSVEFVCGALFGKGLSSYRITHQFEEQFAGKIVSWSGNLRRVERYSYDLVFGSGPGCRAIVDIDSVKSEIGEQRISAIVQFPEGAFNELDAKQGQPISFSGKLSKVDGLMRKIFVSESS